MILPIVLMGLGSYLLLAFYCGGPACSAFEHELFGWWLKYNTHGSLNLNLIAAGGLLLFLLGGLLPLMTLPAFYYSMLNLLARKPRPPQGDRLLRLSLQFRDFILCHHKIKGYMDKANSVEPTSLKVLFDTGYGTSVDQRAAEAQRNLVLLAEEIEAAKLCLYWMKRTWQEGAAAYQPLESYLRSVEQILSVMRQLNRFWSLPNPLDQRFMVERLRLLYRCGKLTKRANKHFWKGITRLVDWANLANSPYRDLIDV